MTPSILLMWSGGVGSTCALLHLLTDPTYKDFDIIVHHLHIRNRNDKAIAEASACRSVLEYIQNKKKYRQFFFSESNHDYLFMTEGRYQRLPHDLDLVSFHAANMCAGNKGIRYVILGSTKTDFEDVSDYKQLFDRAQGILASTLALDEDAMELDVETPLSDFTTKQAYSDLVAPVQKRVFSCINPTYTDKYVAVPCGTCEKCKIRKSLI